VKESKGDLPGALADCSRASEIDPNYFLAYFRRAFIHYLLRDFRAAAHDFRRASEINPKADYPHLYVWLAEMHLGQRERADRQLADYFGDRIKAPGQDRTGRIAAFLLDQLTLAEFLTRESPSGPKSVVPRSQALFFAGMKCLFTGDKNGAARYLRSSVEISRVGPEARVAQAELKALG
jgi:tetratricopeptide (TPR) repeat protein